VLRSSLEFLGDVGPVAILDSQAVAQVGEYVVNVSITGPLDDLRVELSSVPPLQRTDIVALLALGTTTEHLETGQGASGVTAFEATSFLTGGIQDEIEGQMHSVLGFDQFHVDPSYSEARQTTEPRVTVGKAVSDSLYARYGVVLGTQTEQDMSLEYLVTPGMLLLGTWSDQGSETKGSFGGKVRFRFTFR
jgi:autotransporter translocation and assembly factor TamB